MAATLGFFPTVLVCCLTFGALFARGVWCERRAGGNVSFRRQLAFYGGYRILRQPLPAFVLFVGLIYLWLWPSIHFRAMLSLDEYKCMNWSVALDGLLFWSLILDPRPRAQGASMDLGPRILLSLATMVPETVIGAYLSVHLKTVDTVYGICGRFFPIDAVTDQQLGGLITWIPASMMCSLAALIVLRRWIREDARQRGDPVSTRRTAVA